MAGTMEGAWEVAAGAPWVKSCTRESSGSASVSSSVKAWESGIVVWLATPFSRNGPGGVSEERRRYDEGSNGGGW